MKRRASHATQHDGSRPLLERVRQSLGLHLPRRRDLAEHPLLRPIARHVLSPRLWHLQHEAVARGVAIGLFWGFAMPLAQIPLAVAHCIWWRGNIPLSVAATLLTNPFTLGFWLWAAYQTGTLFIDAPPLVMPGEGTSLTEWLHAMGKPVVLGMALFALTLPPLAYGLIKLAWRLRVNLRRRLRRRRAKPAQSRHD